MSETDLAVIGGGPAGMAAAIAAREEGLDDVVIIERAERLGGLLPQCIHNGFGLFYFEEDLTGPEFCQRLVGRCRALGVGVKLNTMVIGLSGGRELTLVNQEEGAVRLGTKALVLAMGCRERARGGIRLPGERPAGILTAGTAQRYVNIDGFIPGKEVVILGSGDIGMIMARRLTLEGARVKGVAEILPYAGGLVRNEVQCLHDFRIPLWLSHTVTYVHGRDRVEGVTVSRVDEHFRPVPGSEREIPCDTLLLSVGLIPENELSLQAGVELDPVTGGPVVNEFCETSVPGIFAGGNVVQVHDLVDHVAREGARAGREAARLIAQARKAPPARIRLRPGEHIRSVVPQRISGEDDAEVIVRVSRPGTRARILAEGVRLKSFRAVKPSESINLQIPAEMLGKFRGKEEIVVSCSLRR